MGILTALKKVGSAVMGGGGIVPSADTVQAVTNVVEHFAPGLEGKEQMVERLVQLSTDGAKDARLADAPMQSGIKWMDAIINGLNRMVRPGITFWLFGGLMGVWHLPDPSSIDPRYWELAKGCFYFYFGSRTLFKDLPAAAKYLSDLRKLRKL